MEMATLKKVFLPFGLSFAVSLFWACSLNIEVEDPTLHGSSDNPASNTPVIFPQDTAKAPIDNPVDIPANDSVGVDTQAVDIIDTPVPEDTVIVDNPENPEPAKDTVYLRDTLIVYKDTIYDTLYDTTSYTSFVYRKNSGMIDTVTMSSKALTCDVNDSSVSCQAKRYIVWADKCCDIRIDPLEEVFFEPNENTIFVHVLDTVYLDAWHEEEYVQVHDTAFVNYGDKRQTDFIPSEFVYKATKNPFDSTAMREFLDTLDFSGADNHSIYLAVQSDLKFKGLPVIIGVPAPLDTVATKLEADGVKYWYWPSVNEARERVYYLDVVGQPSDTTVTWTLGYTHYEKGIVETDSIQVTSFIKVK